MWHPSSSFDPPVLQTVWGNGGDSFYSSMTREAFAALACAALIAICAYTVSFRRLFIRIPELLTPVHSLELN
jgi:hypothetical protein